MQEQRPFPPNVRDGDSIIIELTTERSDDTPENEWAIRSVKVQHNGQPLKVNDDDYHDIALRFLALYVGVAEPGGDAEHARRTDLVRASLDGLLYGASPAGAFTPTKQWIISELLRAQLAGGDKMVTVFIPLGESREAGKREVEALMEDGLVEGKIGVSSAPIRFTREGWDRHRPQ